MKEKYYARRSFTRQLNDLIKRYFKELTWKGVTPIKNTLGITPHEGYISLYVETKEDRSFLLEVDTNTNETIYGNTFDILDDYLDIQEIY